MRLPRLAVFCLSCFCAFVSEATAGTVSGKTVGWTPPNASPYPAVVWLVGGSPPPAEPKVIMAQEGGRFTPVFLVVTVGQTVEMPNLDNVAHNVYSFSPAKAFNLGFYAKGDNKSVVFDHPGLVEVGCSIHNFMRAKILVVPTVYHSIVAPDGSFQMRGVPAGHYTVHFWSDGMNGATQEIDVIPGVSRVDLHVTSGGKETQR